MMGTMQRIAAFSALGLGLAAAADTVVPADEAAALREDFNRRYQAFLRPDSEALLPFPKLTLEACQQLIAGGRLQLVYTESGIPYHTKVYTFTLYREGVADRYYLEAKGGFWGLEHRCYGPLAEKDLR